jgi:hypothetical protein
MSSPLVTTFIVGNLGFALQNTIIAQKTGQRNPDHPLSPIDFLGGSMVISFL